MFHGITHVDVPVTNLIRARQLYETTLGFTLRKEGDGWVDLDTGSVLIRLLAVRKLDHRASIRVQVSDVEAAYKTLVAAGARRVAEAARTPALELLASVADPDGNTIIVWRELTEDEYGFIPELPKEMTWKPDAEALLKSMLLSVPALFRALARYKISRLAEELAEQTNVVTIDCVVRAFILASAKITRYRAREPLIKHGFNPDDYKDEFEA